MERWRMADPFHVYARIEQQEQRRRARKESPFWATPMTQDQTDQIEVLLMEWFRHELSYRPNLGAPRVCSYARDHRSSDVHNDRDEADARIAKYNAEAVAACLDDLPWQQKAAVGMHCRTKHSGVSVVRNPRMTIEEHRLMYLAALDALWPMLKRKGMVT